MAGLASSYLKILNTLLSTKVWSLVSSTILVSSIFHTRKWHVVTHELTFSVSSSPCYGTFWLVCYRIYPVFFSCCSLCDVREVLIILLGVHRFCRMVWCLGSSVFSSQTRLICVYVFVSSLTFLLITLFSFPLFLLFCFWCVWYGWWRRFWNLLYMRMFSISPGSALLPFYFLFSIYITC